MNTLQDMISAIIVVGHSALILRFIICLIREADQENQASANFKKQKRNCVVALILLVCVYDIPTLLQKYFASN